MRRPSSLVLLLLLVGGGPVRGQEESSPEPAPTLAPAAPAVGLERLLRIPPTVDLAPARRGQRDEETWREAFREARLEVSELEQRIEATQTRLRDASPANWGFTAPGAGQQSDPEVLRLRAMLRRDRQSLESSRERLRDLDVEASLAGVPDAWRDLDSDPAAE